MANQQQPGKHSGGSTGTGNRLWVNVIVSAGTSAIVSGCILFVVNYPLGSWWEWRTSAPKVSVALLSVSTPTSPATPLDICLVAELSEEVSAESRQSIWCRDLARLETVDGLKSCVASLDSRLRAVTESLCRVGRVEGLLSVATPSAEDRVAATKILLRDRLLPAAIFEALARDEIDAEPHDADKKIIEVVLKEKGSESSPTSPFLVVQYGDLSRDVAPIMQLERFLSVGLGHPEDTGEKLAEIVSYALPEDLLACCRAARDIIVEEAGRSEAIADYLRQLVLEYGTWHVRVHYLNEGGRPALLSATGELSLSFGEETLRIPLVSGTVGFSAMGSTLASMMKKTTQFILGFSLLDVVPAVMREEQLSNLRVVMESEARSTQCFIMVGSKGDDEVDYYSPSFEVGLADEQRSEAASRYAAEGCTCVFSTSGALGELGRIESDPVWFPGQQIARQADSR